MTQTMSSKWCYCLRINITLLRQCIFVSMILYILFSSLYLILIIITPTNNYISSNIYNNIGIDACHVSDREQLLLTCLQLFVKHGTKMELAWNNKNKHTICFMWCLFFQSRISFLSKLKPLKSLVIFIINTQHLMFTMICFQQMTNLTYLSLGATLHKYARLYLI